MQASEAASGMGPYILGASVIRVLPSCRSINPVPRVVGSANGRHAL
jgi:hypothetical protein